MQLIYIIRDIVQQCNLSRKHAYTIYDILSSVLYLFVFEHVPYITNKQFIVSIWKYNCVLYTSILVPTNDIIPNPDIFICDLSKPGHG